MSKIIRKRWVSMRQREVLWEFLNSHRELATAFNRSLQAKENSKKRWCEIAKTLNAQGDGCHKGWKEWCKYWVDYKAKLKIKATLCLAHSATKGGSSTVQPLSEIETKFLQLLGEDFVQGLPGIRAEPFSGVPENSRSTLSEDDALSSDISLSDPLQEPQEHKLKAEPAYSPTPTAFTPPPVPSTVRAERPQRRQRRRRGPTMTQEAARLALVESSRLRAEAAMRSSHASELRAEAAVRNSYTLENIQNSLQNIERLLSNALGAK